MRNWDRYEFSRCVREGGGGRGGEVRRYSIYWLIRSCLSLGQACQNGSIPTALSALFPRFGVATNSEPLPVSYALGWGIACPNPPIPSTSLIYVFSIFFPTQRHRSRPMVFSDKRGTSAWTTSSLFCWETTRTLNHLRAVGASSPILTRRSTPQTITDNGYWRTSKYVVMRLMADCDWLINWLIVWLTAWITDHLIYWLTAEW